MERKFCFNCKDTHWHNSMKPAGMSRCVNCGFPPSGGPGTAKKAHNEAVCDKKRKMIK